MVTAAILLIGAAGSLLTGVAMRSERISFPLKGGGVGNGILYLPGKTEAGPIEKPPLVFLLPGIISPADRFEMMAGELTRAGYAACALYIPGRDARLHLEIARAASRHLKQNHPEIDHGRKAVFGHSLGAEPAVMFAFFDDDIRATVVVGYYIANVVQASPKNLLMGTGVYDDLNGPDKLIAAIRTFSDGKIDHPGIRIGDFKSRTARELFISPFSMHSSEVEDAYVIGQLIRWLDLSFGQAKHPAGRLIYPWRAFFGLVLLIGVFLFVVMIALALFSRARKAAKIIWLMLLVFCGGLTFAPGLAAWPFLEAFFVLLVSGLFAHYYTRKGESFAMFFPGFRKTILHITILISLFCIGFSISQFLFAINTWSSETRYLAAFPGALYLSFYLTPVSNMVGFSNMFKVFNPGIIALVLGIGLAWYCVELVKLGITGDMLAKLAGFVRFKHGGRIPLKEGALLAVLFAVLGAILFWLKSMNLLTGSVLGPFTRTILQYVLVPLGLWIAMVSVYGKVGKHWRQPGR